MNSNDVLRPVSGTANEWDERLQGFGKVVFRHKLTKILLSFAGAIAAALIGLFLGYWSSGVGDTSAFVLSALIVIPILLVVFTWSILWSRKKTVVVETDGVRLTNNVLVPWGEIVDTGVWSYRGPAMVTLKVAPSYMREYQARLNPASRMLTKLNSAFGGGDTLYLPGMLDTKPEELSAWIATLISRHHAKTSSNWGDRTFEGLTAG